MFVIRPVRASDLDAVLELAACAGSGLTTLPNDADQLRKKIAASESVFADADPEPDERGYLFVLEQRETGKVVGTCGIVAAVGQSDAFYNYRLGKTVYASRELGVYNPIDTLSLSNDLTGSSELGTLFLHPDYRGGGRGRLLSASRFLFLRKHAARFNTRVIAELRGVADAQGHSPFWENLGRKFFAMDFSTADALSATSMRSFIAELMPKQPLDTVLLPDEARAVIGEVHAQTRPARQMLEAEGFRFRGYVDIFDAGPALEAELPSIRTVRKARDLTLNTAVEAAEAQSLMVARGRLGEFRCALVDGEIHGSELRMAAAAATTLGAKQGERVSAILLARHGSPAAG